MTLTSIRRAAFNTTWSRMVRLSTRAACPYGSHIPVLMICCAIFKPKTVLELGTGFYSTPLFLNTSICPSLKLLHSVENDRRWFEQLQTAMVLDNRWKTEMWEGPVAAKIGKLDLRAYDMVFIDDSSNQTIRSQTIQAVYALNPLCPVVIHDAELWRLRARIGRRSPQVIFDVFNPQTAVCLQRQPLKLTALRQSRKNLRSESRAGQIATSSAEWEAIGRRAVQKLVSGLPGLSSGVAQQPPAKRL